MNRLNVVAGLVVSLALVPVSAAVALAGAPDQGIIKQLLSESYNPGGHNTALRIDFHAITISPGHKASAHEGMQYQVALGQTIYPVRAAWTTTVGSGPAAYVRDYDTHYFAFRSEQKHGAWDLTSNPQKGDKNGVLRGG